MSRKRSSREQMQSWVARFERSGLSAARFCERHGIRAERLSYWRRVAGQASVPGPRESRSPRVQLTPVRVLDLASPSSQGDLEVQLASGDRLLIREGVSSELLRGTLLVLREGC
jgi:transposase-like protein